MQTLEGQPAIVHAGPFANIAHGNSSLVGDLVGLKLADYVVTEGGFASDLGFEKFVHIVCLTGGLSPLSCRPRRHDPGAEAPRRGSGRRAQALERGAENLAAHLRIVKELGFDAVVAVNRFPADSQFELEAVSALALEHGAFGVAVNDGYEHGGAGASAWQSSSSRRGSERAGPVPVRARRSDRGARCACPPGVRRDWSRLSPVARATLERLPAELHRLPVCVAKTHLSLSHDPELTGAPQDFVLPVRELRAYTGAGWIVAVCGETQTMPGLPANSAAERMDLDAEGRIVGLA